MKKIFAILFIIAIALTLTACGPNDDYYNLGTVNYYYYNDEDFEINPYDYIREYNEWLELSNKEIRNAQIYFDVNVLYREKDSGEDYKEFEFMNEENHIYTKTPLNDLKNGRKYEFKIHFLDKENPSEKDMINYYGVFSFIKSPADAKIKQKTLEVGTTYNLLDNVKQLDPTTQLQVDFYDLYTVKYFVNDVEVKYNPGEVLGDYTFDTAGTYDVMVQLTEIKEEDSSTDATSGASANDDGGLMVLEVKYEVTVTEPAE